MNKQFATLVGGIDLSITKLDGSTESVKVRQLPVKLFPQYLATMLDEQKQVELLCDRQPGWADTLTPDSHELIVMEGEKLNRDFFSRWLQRKKEREALIPKPSTGEVVAMLEAINRANPALLEDLMQKATSQTSLPKPQSPAA